MVFSDAKLRVIGLSGQGVCPAGGSTLLSRGKEELAHLGYRGANYIPTKTFTILPPIR